MGAQEWPDLINWLVTPNSRANNLVLFNSAMNKNCFILFVLVALEAVARVNQVIYNFIA